METSCDDCNWPIDTKYLTKYICKDGRVVYLCGDCIAYYRRVGADKGLKCNDCHTKLFQMKKGAAMKMADLNAGKFCGECHNGTKAFKTSDAGTCGKCHKK